MIEVREQTSIRGKQRPVPNVSRSGALKNVACLESRRFAQFVELGGLQGPVNPAAAWVMQL